MKKFFFVVLIILSIADVSYAQQTKNVDVKEFKMLMDKAANKIILDVRTDSEVAQGGLPNAVQIDYNGSNFDSQIDKLDKNKPVFVYCAVGGRSGKTAAILAKKGFKNVYNLAGGINAWRAAGMQTIPLKK